MSRNDSVARGAGLAQRANGSGAGKSPAARAGLRDQMQRGHAPLRPQVQNSKRAAGATLTSHERAQAHAHTKLQKRQLPQVHNTNTPR